ncbi:hypothetical protein Q8F55_001532 [Vanrija albida]|uniref:Xylanolytic transcriptional activator regulatory domain-containing protein n=1 Tax=Vanrija albida TaxID=181172 RepID=A0ABR3QGG9_9TREE
MRAPSSESPGTSPKNEFRPSSFPQATDQSPHDAGAAASGAADGGAGVDVSGTGYSTRAPSPGGLRVPHPPRQPLFGLPTSLVERLLSVYFTHIHNVWPLIYKPLFNPHTTSAPLLLAMLAIASCVATREKNSSNDEWTQEKLFNRAESSLHHCRMDNRIDIVQALVLLSLRQTGCGDKRMAFSYAGRACCMALNLGLNLAPAHPESPADSELRSRVYWNCYILDKTLAEETGRSFILPYRRSSTPLPSMTESDEFEMWPPLPTSLSPMPRSVRHIVPRRGYVMSCFVWTCRLGLIVEDILDMEQAGPPTDTDGWEQAFTAPLPGVNRDPAVIAEHINSKLEAWRAALPSTLEVDLSPNVSPLPHHVVGLSWYYTAQILLHSRFIKQRPSQFVQDTEEGDQSLRAHGICTKASEQCVNLLAHLDRHQLLAQVSADIIHILSLATLFEAFDASDTNDELAHRAKVNFAQCCIWLRNVSSNWPAASTHKVYFEGLIQGGLKLSSPDDDAASPANKKRRGTMGAIASPSSLVESPSIPEGLRQVGRALSSTAGSTLPAISLPPLGVSSLFQLPQFYWNHLTNAVPGQGGGTQPARFDQALDIVLGSPEASGTMDLAEWSPLNYSSTATLPSMGQTPQSGPPTNASTNAPFQTMPQQQQQQQVQSQGQQQQQQQQVPQQLQQQQQPQPTLPWEMDQSSFMNSGTLDPLDPSAIYSTLMSYMVEAARSR